MNKAVSVSKLNSYIKAMFGNDEVLSDVLVRGEVSNFKRHYSGHMYFTLKDENAALGCVMFSSMGAKLSFEPEDGMEVVASGYVSVYEKSGRYQLYVSGMLPEGEGTLYQTFEKLKKSLLKEGLFSKEHKKTIPFLPEKIGVVTSATGSVIRDIRNVLERRYPGFNIILYPSNVQGKGAEIEIAAGIEHFNKTKSVDVIIIARGGGSIEDLWPFNEELLAREIFKSEIPVISAVGHETDFTISDFAADLRAPTPSAAAELAVPELAAAREKIRILNRRMRASLENGLELQRKRLESLKSRPVMKRPEEIFNLASLAIDRAAEKIESGFKALFEKKDADFREVAAKLELLSPLGTISRGYSVISDEKGHVITSIADVSEGDFIHSHIRDGSIWSNVIKTEGKNGKEII